VNVIHVEMPQGSGRKTSWCYQPRSLSD
jgi:hypothetical protein